MAYSKMIVQEQPRIASELIEIPVTSGATRATLPDVPQLRNQGDQVVVITTVRLVTPKVLTYGPVTGTANMTLTDYKKCSIVLYCNGWEKGHLIPLLTLNDYVDSDSAAATSIPYRQVQTRLDNWVNVDWNKSYIQFSNGQSASGSSVVILEVEYFVMQKQPNGAYQQVEVR